jgi:hypothetical protein
LLDNGLGYYGIRSVSGRTQTINISNGTLEGGNLYLVLRHFMKGRAHTKDRPVLSSERAPHGNKNVTVRQK